MVCSSRDISCSLHPIFTRKSFRGFLPQRNQEDFQSWAMDATNIQMKVNQRPFCCAYLILPYQYLCYKWLAMQFTLQNQEIVTTFRHDFIHLAEAPNHRAYQCEICAASIHCGWIFWRFGTIGPVALQKWHRMHRITSPPFLWIEQSYCNPNPQLVC